MKIKATNVFERNWEAFNKEGIVYIKNEGSSRSSKTFSICQLLIIWALKNPNKIISVIRKHSTTVKNTVMKQDFIPMLKDMGLYSSSKHNKTDATYTFDNGTIIEFYGADDDEKLHGRKRDIAWLNEATELLWDDFKQIAMRTTGKIIIDYNPSAPTSFLYELPEDKTAHIHSTYKDNPFLTQTQIDFIEDLKNTDPVGWQIYGLGKRGIAKENVFPLWERVKKKPDYIKDYVYGIDFGFSHPTALVKVWYNTDKKESFIEEEIYASNLTSDELVDEMNRLNIDKTALILADYARPEMISSMRKAGYTVLEADKSVQAGINSVRRFKIMLCENALNIKKENELYKYKKIGDIITDEPIKKYDDCIDSIRYAFRYIDSNLMRDNNVPTVYVFDF
jgi:phage terminase large subunit